MARAATQADADGLSLAELQAIGAEAGIDPAFVAAAAAEFNTPEPANDTPWWYAGPATVKAECVVPGTITDGPVWAAIVRELRNTFDADGIATQLADTMEWSFDQAQGTESTRVTVTPESYGTRIRITQSMRELAQVGPILGGSFGLTGLIIGTLLAMGNFDPEVAGITILFVVLSLLCIGAGIPLYRAYARRRQRRLDSLMDRLELIALKEMPPASDTATTAPGTHESATSGERLGEMSASSEDVPDKHRASPSRSQTRS